MDGWAVRNRIKPYQAYLQCLHFPLVCNLPTYLPIYSVYVSMISGLTKGGGDGLLYIYMYVCMI